MSTWQVHSDGGCVGNPGPAGFGVVVVAPGGGTIENSGFIGHGTNQIAELTAAIVGLTLTPAGSDVILYSDSQYTLKGISEWRAGWEQRGMKTAANKPVANAALWIALWKLVDARRVRTQWVKGHNGDVHNERCDVLAGIAIAQRKSESISAAAQPKPAGPQKAGAWMPLASRGDGVEPEGVLVLYGLVMGNKVVRAESGVRSGVVRGCMWATHWAELPAAGVAAQ